MEQQIDRYDKLRKLTRNQAIEQMRQNHPEKSLSDIGREFNVTRQRVCSILKSIEKRKNKIQAAELATA